MKQDDQKMPSKPEPAGLPVSSPGLAGATLKDDCFTLPPEGSAQDREYDRELERIYDRWQKGETGQKAKAPAQKAPVPQK